MPEFKLQYYVGTPEQAEIFGVDKVVTTYHYEHKEEENENE